MYVVTTGLVVYRVSEINCTQVKHELHHWHTRQLTSQYFWVIPFNLYPTISFSYDTSSILILTQILSRLKSFIIFLKFCWYTRVYVLIVDGFLIDLYLILIYFIMGIWASYFHRAAPREAYISYVFCLHTVLYYTVKHLLDIRTTYTYFHSLFLYLEYSSSWLVVII